MGGEFLTQTVMFLNMTEAWQRTGCKLTLQIKNVTLVRFKWPDGLYFETLESTFCLSQSSFTGFFLNACVEVLLTLQLQPLELVNTGKLRLIFLCLILNGFTVYCTLWSSSASSTTGAHLTMWPKHKNNSKDNQIEIKCTFSLSLVVDARGPQPKGEEEAECLSCCSVWRSAGWRADCSNTTVSQFKMGSLKRKASLSLLCGKFQGCHTTLDERGGFLRRQHPAHRAYRLEVWGCWSINYVCWWI